MLKCVLDARVFDPGKVGAYPNGAPYCAHLEG
jgi:hypothetical protein